MKSMAIRTTSTADEVRRRAAAPVRFGRLLLAALALVFLTSDVADARTAARKGGRALAAMTTAFLEVPGNMYREGQRDGPGGVALGFAKGLGMIVPRVLVGVYELLTVPIPAPAGFRPILQPEFPWSYFD